MKHILSLAGVLAIAVAAPLTAQVIQPPFAGVYAFADLGLVPGVPPPYGGITFKRNDNNTLLIGGEANAPNGAIYQIGVARGTSGNITGFVGTATIVSTAPNIDGGLCYAPNGVLMYTTYPTHDLGQIRPGSTAPDRVIALGALGINGSTGTLAFVPQGFAGAGQLKIASYGTGDFYGCTIAPDANGTYDVTVVNGPTTLPGGPEGILYVPPGSSLIPDYQYVLISEWVAGEVALYQLDAVGNPVLASRQPFINGLGGAEGACTDPVTGDLFFSTFGGGDRVLRVSGFGVCGSFTNYGAGIAGLNGVPTIGGGGCAGRGQVASIQIGSGRTGALGLLALGFLPDNVGVLNGTLLVQIVNTYFHLLDGTGSWSLTILLPADPAWTGLNIYAQGFYIDAAGAFGVSATNGLHVTVR